RRGTAALLDAARRVLLFAAVLAAATAAARRLGGFFAAPPDGATSGIVRHLGILDTPADSLRWHLATFGLLLPLGLAGLFPRTRGRVVLAALGAGALLTLNSVRYGLSWDIVKFGVVADITLALLAGAALARLWGVRPALPARALAATLLVAAIAP